MRRKQGRGQFQEAHCRGGETGRRGGFKELGAILKRRELQKEARPSNGGVGVRMGGGVDGPNNSLSGGNNSFLGGINSFLGSIVVLSCQRAWGGHGHDAADHDATMTRPRFVIAMGTTIFLPSLENNS